MSGNYPPWPPNQPPNQPSGQPGPYGPSGPGPGGPPPDQGYSFGPFAAPPPVGPGGPEGPYGGGPGGPGGPYQPYAPPPEPPKKRSKLPIIIAAAVVALALIATGIVLAVRQSTPTATGPYPAPSDPAPGSPSTDPSTDQPTAEPSTPPTAAQSTQPTTRPTTAPSGPTSADAVTGYLRAVAAGNANAALQYAARPLRQEATMTNAVLADSRRRAPMTGIAVAPGTDPNATQVRASYRLGKTPVSTVYDVVKVANAWKLTKIVNDISVRGIRHRTVPMKVNGADVRSDTIRLFPGAYDFSAGSRYLSYGDRHVVTVRAPTELVTSVYSLRRQLTPRGISKVRTEAKKRWDACLDSESPRPSNCPFRWTDNAYRYDDGSVNWTRTGADPFRRAQVLLDTNQGPALSVPFRVGISGDCRYQGRRGTCRGTVTGTGVGTIDLARPNPRFRWQ